MFRLHRTQCHISSKIDLSGSCGNIKYPRNTDTFLIVMSFIRWTQYYIHRSRLILTESILPCWINVCSSTCSHLTLESIRFWTGSKIYFDWISFHRIGSLQKMWCDWLFLPICIKLYFSIFFTSLDQKISYRYSLPVWTKRYLIVILYRFGPKDIL